MPDPSEYVLEQPLQGLVVPHRAWRSRGVLALFAVLVGLGFAVFLSSMPGVQPITMASTAAAASAAGARVVHLRPRGWSTATGHFNRAATRRVAASAEGGDDARSPFAKSSPSINPFGANEGRSSQPAVNPFGDNAGSTVRAKPAVNPFGDNAGSTVRSPPDDPESLARMRRKRDLDEFFQDGTSEKEKKMDYSRLLDDFEISPGSMELEPEKNQWWNPSSWEIDTSTVEALLKNPSLYIAIVQVTFPFILLKILLATGAIHFNEEGT